MYTKEELAKFQAEHDKAISVAMDLFEKGDVEGARQKLFDAGISFDGICDYLAAWTAP